MWETHVETHDATDPKDVPKKLPDGEQLLFTVALGTITFMPDNEDGLFVLLNDKPIGPMVPDEETGRAIVAWFTGYLGAQVNSALKEHETSQRAAAGALEQVAKANSPGN